MEKGKERNATAPVGGIDEKGTVRWLVGKGEKKWEYLDNAFIERERNFQRRSFLGMDMMVGGWMAIRSSC